MEEYNSDFQVAKLMKEFDKAGIETELFEEYRYAPAPWQIEPMNRKYLKNMPQRYCEIRRQVLEDIERETVGYINPGAKTIIDKGMGSSSNNKVHLDIDGMGIVFYSAETMKDVIPNTDFLSSEFTSPQQIANHIKKGDITAFCTGSSGSFDIHFFEGYPSVDILEKFPVSIRLALDVQGGSVQFCDLFWLSKWNTDFPQNQIIYPLFKSITMDLASKYELKHRSGHDDTRRLRWKKQLELLKIVDTEFYEKRKKEIEEILKTFPYVQS